MVAKQSSLPETAWVTWPWHPENSGAISGEDLQIKRTNSVFGRAAREVHDPVIVFMQHFSSWESA